MYTSELQTYGHNDDNMTSTWP